jgi:hypothetical protein
MDNSQDFDQIFIGELRLSRRTFNALHRSGIFTVGKLKGLLHTNKLEKIHFIGAKSIEEISNAIAELHKYHLPVDQAGPVSGNKLTDLLSEKAPEDIKIEPVGILGLRPSIRGALIKNGIRTIGDLMNALDSDLLNMNLIGPKMLVEIQQALKHSVDEYRKHITKRIDKDDKEILGGGTIKAKEDAVEIEELHTNWAETIQSYFESEKSTYTYVLTSRFGYKPKTLEEIAKELGVTRERVRQIQDSVVARFLKFLRFQGTGLSRSTTFLGNINRIFLDYGENLSLTSFKNLLRQENLLGQFTESFMIERLKKVDLFETLICWLNLLTDKRYNTQPVVFPIDIFDLVQSGKLSIKDHDILQKISQKDRKKIRRKVLFTGGITIKESAKILSTDERVAVLVLESLNFQQIDKEWFSFKDFDEDKDNSKIPLRMAGLKMLAINPEMEIGVFHEGLRRHASRFYTSIAPLHVVSHILPMLGFKINNFRVTTSLSTVGILAQSEKALISAISKNEGVASFLEIAEEFFLRSLSLPSVSKVLKQSPIAEKITEGLYKLRGLDISWQQIEEAKKRQKRFSQDSEVTHGLDGVVRMKLTVNSYAFLTGVIGAYSIKELSGSWSVINDGKSFDEAKIDEGYLWGLAKLFKNLKIEVGDRIELAFNTWNRTLSVKKVHNENPR